MTIAAIRQFLKHPDCIVFVGSGISMWSNLPGWSGLLEELAAFLDKEGQPSDLVRREIGSGDLLQAASFGVSKLTPASFGTFIRRAVRHGAASPHAIHKAIVNLGPTAFITTNYDTLIEQALGSWRTDAFFPAPVTNKHLVELADIVSARSSHFIFKPHGDISDVSSVILTREQYRMLMPGGERQSALETLKTLLVTRPILYVGFGLRDPDFVYLRDLLLNIYQGAVRDHWAIMPDIVDGEVDYWRNQYGIKLLGYETHRRSDGSRDHRDLLSMLQALAAPDAASLGLIRLASDKTSVPSEAERVLALTRYTSGLIRRLTPTSTPIEARISRPWTTHSYGMGFGVYEDWTTTRFLTEGPQSAYLIGLPGSGKSFALRLATLQLATKLQHACMEDTLPAARSTLPVLLDLKLYRGDLRAQIDAELPAGFSLDQLRGNLRMKLFLDAFNEMPSEHLESGAFLQELDALRGEIGNFEYAITSRTPDGLPEWSGEPTLYEIDRFEKSYVDATLAEHRIQLSGMFADDIRHLLSRPFFLQLIAKGLVEVPVNASPRDLLASFLAKLQLAFSDRFKADLPLLPLFAKLAYRAIETESEAFPLAWLSDLIATQVPDTSTFSAADVVNWLIAREVLIPFTGRRVSFVHQSITEYCAATELARRLQTDTVSLRDTIASKRWDQCLLLALALMETKTAETVLTDAIEADFNLAVNAIRYAEDGQSAAVTHLLKVLVDRTKDVDPQRHPYLSLRHLPVGPEHIELLRQLLPVGNSIAGEATRLIAQVLGDHFKAELLDLLEAHAGDFNFAANGIAPALGPFIEEHDLPRLISIAKTWLAKVAKDEVDRCAAISDVMARFEPVALEQAVKDADGRIPSPMVSFLGDALKERGDDASIELLTKLLLAHPAETTSSFYLALGRRVNLAVPTTLRLDHRHVEAIWSARFSADLWGSALSRVCRSDPDLKAYVERMAERHNGIESIALRYCAGVDDEAFFAELEHLLAFDDAMLKHQPFELLELSKFAWRGRENLLVQSLVRDLPRLRLALLKNADWYETLASGSVGLAMMQPVIELVETELGNEKEWWIHYWLGKIVARLGDAQVQAFCLDALVRGSTPLRQWVIANYISAAKGLTSDALDDDMIASLLADLAVPNRISAHWYNPLGHIATDRFVRERLLPLAQDASATFRENLLLVLKAAGDRHGRRYMLPT